MSASIYVGHPFPQKTLHESSFFRFVVTSDENAITKKVVPSQKPCPKGQTDR
ncbi:MAG: hypothetical protein NZ937_00600 [Armatimonadetes bacterium]|nr:hypothetical protein [Armatimonadota bacterium]